ncbi:hypothetical protein C7271_19360, partial [filamentous cyanobacterium CCP5]
DVYKRQELTHRRGAQRVPNAENPIFEYSKEANRERQTLLAPAMRSAKTPPTEQPFREVQDGGPSWSKGSGGSEFPPGDKSGFSPNCGLTQVCS